MNEKTQIKLQAYLDSELSAAERQEIEALLQRDREAADLLLELQQTSRALTGFEAEIKLPESHDFYWSRIRRQIEQETPEVRPQSSRLAWLRQFLVPAGSFAAIAIVVMVSLTRPAESLASFTDTNGAVAFTYQNYETGTTLVWLDFPENNFSESTAADNLGL